MAKSKQSNHEKSNKGNNKNSNNGSSDRNRTKTIYHNPKFVGADDKMNGNIFDCTSRNQADVYKETMKVLVDLAGRTLTYGIDIRFVLENLAEPTILRPPKLTTKEITDDYCEALINKKEIEEYVKRLFTLKTNKMNVFSIVLGQCTDALIAKLETTTDFLTVKTENDLVKLLLAIRQIVFKFEEQEYIPASLFNAKKTFFNFYQTERMQNIEYMEKFQTIIDVVENYGGSLGNDEILLKDDAEYMALVSPSVDEKKKAQLDAKKQIPVLRFH